MPIYTYRCSQCGPFERVRPIADRKAQARCPSCEAVSHRVFDSPYLPQNPAALGRAKEAADHSAEKPAVATRTPEPERPTPDRVPGYPPLPRM